MKRFFPILLLLLLFVSFASYAQSVKSVKGIVQDTLGNAMQSVRVRLNSPSDSLTAATNETGAFTITGVKASKFTISVSFMGFETFTKEFTIDANSTAADVGVLKIREMSNELETVTIQGVIPVIVKEDTLEFSAAAYPVREGDAVEEMVKKLPGVTVDKDGNVTTAEGKPITKIRVNNKDFFGEDVATAIQSLPADIVKSLQIIDDYGDEARLTGIKSDEPTKVLNIVILPEKNKGYTAQGGLGKGDQNRYTGDFRGNIFKGERQISMQGFLGNVNRRGGSNGNGITDTKNVGVNYRDQLSPKVSVDGSYFFESRDNNTVGSVFSQNIFLSRTDDQLQNSDASSLRHNFNGNFEYKIDTMNYLKISPNMSYNSSRNGSLGLTNTSIPDASSIRNNKSSSTASTPNFGVSLNFNHKFAKRGRNFGFNANLGYNDSDQDRDTRNTYVNTDSTLNTVTTTLQNQMIGTSNTNRRDGFRVSYNEPLTQTSFLQFSYGLNHTNTNNIRDIYDIDATGQDIFNSTLSNNYQYKFITNRAGLNYRVVKKKYNYTLGIAAQPVTLEGLDISRNITTENKTFNWVPNARFVYKFSTKSSFTVNYNGRSNQPGFSQLQPITDNSNLQNTIVGNPNLKPEFTNSLEVNFNQTDLTKGYLMFTNFSYNDTQNKIVTTRQTTGTQQLTSYLNTNGFYNVNGNYLYSKFMSQRKYTITYNGGANYSNNVAFNNNERSLSKNLTFRQGLRFKLDIKDKIDMTFNTNYSINTTRYSSELFQDRNVKALNLGIGGRSFFFKDLTLGYDFSKTINDGYTGGINQNPVILNLFTEYRFFKRAASVKLQGFDLFNQNTGISRNVSGDQIVDSQYNQLARYFLLSFNLRLSKFSGSKPGQNNNQNGRPGNFGGGQGGYR